MEDHGSWLNGSVNTTTNKSLAAGDVAVFPNPYLEHRLVLAIEIVGWLILQTVGTFLLTHLIRVEKDLNMRTVLDHILHNGCIFLLVGNLLMVNMNFVMVFTGGGWPHGLCGFLIFIRQTCCELGLQILLVQSAIFRCLYMTVWKNVGMVDDYAVCFILDVLTPLTAAAISLTLLILHEGFYDFKMPFCMAVTEEVRTELYPRYFSTRRIINAYVSDVHMMLMIIITIVILVGSRKLKSPFANHPHPAKRHLLITLITMLLAHMGGLPYEIRTFLQMNTKDLTIYPGSILFALSDITPHITTMVVMPIILIGTSSSYRKVVWRNMLSDFSFLN